MTGFDHVDFAAHEIGARDDLSRETAEKSAWGVALAITRLPDATHHLMISGYDDDPRELWDIPEVCVFVRQFSDSLAARLPVKPLGHWSFAEPSLALLAMCLGTGRVQARDPVTGVFTIAVIKDADDVADPTA
jgi:hypothetical protein